MPDQHDFAEHGRLLARASVGPWRQEWNDYECHECGVDVLDATSLRVALCEFDDDTCLDDAALIVALRNSAAAYRAVVLAAADIDAHCGHTASQAGADDPVEVKAKRLVRLRAALAAFRNVGGGS